MITEMRVWMNEDELQTISRATNSNAGFAIRAKDEIFSTENWETSAGTFPERTENKFSTFFAHYRGWGNSDIDLNSSALGSGTVQRTLTSNRGKARTLIGLRCEIHQA
jgi:hypothetical protein